LIGRGVRELEHAVGYQLPLHNRLKRLGSKIPLSLYLISIFLITCFATGMMALRAYHDGVSDAVIVLLGVLGMIASSQLALTLVNWIATLITLPRLLARMDFSAGIPVESRTLVVIPCMLFNQANIDQLTERLEVRFLANRDSNLGFCLLSDFADAATEILPSDAALLDRLKKTRRVK